MVGNEECAAGFQNIYDIILKAFNDSAVEVFVNDSLVCSTGDAAGFCQDDDGSLLLIKCEGDEQDLQLSVVSDEAFCIFNGVSSFSTATFDQIFYDFIVLNKLL